MQRTYYPPLVDETAMISLTPGQHAVFERVMVGRTDLEISRELHYSADTVKSHVRKIREKVGVKNRAHLIALVYCGAVRVLVPVGESSA